MGTGREGEETEKEGDEDDGKDANEYSSFVVIAMMVRE